MTAQKTEQPKQTQPQILWEMAFSTRLNDVIYYERSLSYWQNEEARFMHSKAFDASKKRVEAREKIKGLKPTIYVLREKLAQWVKEHPYPAD